jgi:glycosyltransferase involved in cell wall biosynthesis
MMDDAWEMTDKRGMLTTLVKRLIHRNIDGVFIPAPTHNAYYQHMGFPADRIVYGVDVVDNDVYSSCADAARTNADSVRASLGLPQRYLLFVGRLMPRKGLHILLEAYHRYRMRAGDSALSLVLIGDGALMDTVEQLAAKIGSVYCLGPRFGEELCSCYGLAQALIVPSAFDSWGLVVNEGLASGLPVIVSTGCGAAETLVEVGGNGWTYTYDDRDELAGLMAHVNGLTDEELRRMGKRSREIIAAWSLDRFADGVIEALNLPRRMPGGMLADMAAKLWKGRVRIN